MKTTDLFRHILHQCNVRQTGKTTLLKEGIDNYDKPFFYVCRNVKYGQAVCKNKNAIFVTPASYMKLRGSLHPIIVDSEFIAEYLPKAFDEVFRDGMKMGLSNSKYKEL